ncbi:ACT domain-containing protein [Cadophora sp. MPI-SDFR-AT-0126]|nr:ACT domain-containing protein [Leotiomycetes sp. MPI-SDFR-AT-0126]
MNAQISFIEGQFSLIHIPLPLYASLLQPILRILLPHGGPTHTPLDPEGPLSGLSQDNKHHFLNISVTPLECSIVCHVSWAQNVFAPLISRLPPQQAKECHISKDTYIVFSVNSAGMEAGQRVMDLTAPLAMAAIPIFFITTYYTDFILVPSKDRQTVGAALLERGFEFSENESAYVVQAPSLNHAAHSRIPSASSSESAGPPSTPPPSNVAELQIRTFKQLRKRGVVPFIEPDLHLVQCSGKEILQDDSYHSNSNGHNGYYQNGHSSSHSQIQENTFLSTIDPKFYIGLISALITQPRFLSITLAQDDAPSLLLDKSLLWLFGNSIAGDVDGELVPIFLDLGGLPLESTGIVCGVAGKLCEVERMGGACESENGGGDGNGSGSGNGMSDGEGAELSYLSTARAGAVILSKGGSVRALEALGPLLEAES